MTKVSQTSVEHSDTVSQTSVEYSDKVSQTSVEPIASDKVSQHTLLVKPSILHVGSTR